jgi:hypothetical protein
MGRSVQVETARSHCSGSAAYELRLLGGFQLLKHGDDVETLPSTQRVLAFLALNDRFLPRAYVAESLWPDTTDEKAAANLRTALWRLHVCGHDIIDIVSSRIRLYPSVWIDVRFVENEARHYRATGRVPGTAVLDQVHGELLPGCWDSWLVFERERLRVELIHLYEEIGRAALVRSDEHIAVLAGIAAVTCGDVRSAPGVFERAADLGVPGGRQSSRRHSRVPPVRDAARRRARDQPRHRREASPHERGAVRAGTGALTGP